MEGWVTVIDWKTQDCKDIILPQIHLYGLSSPQISS